MDRIKITIGAELFIGRLEHALAPRTCAVFETLLPFADELVHARWSGEACWIPMGARDLGLGLENATGTPGPGQLLLHPAGISETEILVPYGAVRFASVAGPLTGNHFLTVEGDLERLAAVGRGTLRTGAAAIRFERA
jgi:hypothetical protein